MNGRYLMIATAALLGSGQVAAESAKPAVQPTAQPSVERPTEVVMASADNVRAPALLAQAQPATPAKKPRAARVTSCRCAGQAAPTDQ